MFDDGALFLLKLFLEIFCDTRREKLPSTYLVDRLVAMKERPWPEYRHGKEITPRQVAMLLKPFGIVPGTKRDGDYHFKGYELEQFIDAFTRYLDDSSVTNEPDVTDRKSTNPRQIRVVTASRSKGGIRQRRTN